MSLAPITHSREIVVRLTTDAGLQGIGQCHGGPMEQVGRIITGPFREVLIGADPFEHERLWSEMFAHNHRPGWSLNGWRHETIMTAIAGVDIALWDLMGKASGRSVCELLGGLRTEAEAYATGGLLRGWKRHRWFGRRGRSLCRRTRLQGGEAEGRPRRSGRRPRTGRRGEIGVSTNRHNAGRQPGMGRTDGHPSGG